LPIISILLRLIHFNLKKPLAKKGEGLEEQE
jgi:hypothetical protein